MRSALQRHASAGTAALLLIVLVIVAALKAPKLFTSLDGLAAGLAVAAPLVLATMALTPVAIGVRGGIDLAVGPLMSLINCGLVVWLIDNGVTSPVVVVPAAVLIGVGAGLAQGLLVAIVRIPAIIASLGGFLIFGGLALEVLPQPGGAVPQWLADLAGRTGPLPNAAVVIGVSCAAWWALARSTLVRNIRLAGGNETPAFTAGIDTRMTRLAAYALGGVFAGIAGLLLTAELASGDPSQGSAYTLQTVAALVLGGTSLAGGRGTMLGSVIAAFDIYLINYVIATFDFGAVSGYVTQLAYGVTLVASLAFGVLATRYAGHLLQRSGA